MCSYTYNNCNNYILYIIDVTAIIYVVATSSFNMVIREDNRTVSNIIFHWNDWIVN